MPTKKTVAKRVVKAAPKAEPKKQSKSDVVAADRAMALAMLKEAGLRVETKSAWHKVAGQRGAAAGLRLGEGTPGAPGRLHRQGTPRRGGVGE